jgi:hypothetical protein
MADDVMADEPTGIAIRFVRQFQPSPDPLVMRAERALWLMMGDDRDVSFAQKFADAMEFIRLLEH